VVGGTILLEPVEDPDDPSPSTKCCPELAKHLDISLGCRPRTRMVQWCHVWRWQPWQSTSQSVMAFAVIKGEGTPEDAVLRVHVTW